MRLIERIPKAIWALPVFWCLLAGAQEEDSAEFFLESYSDAFQQTFFEALKEKGIENYDRAEALLLECKQMDPLDPVLDHELAKVLIRQKQYPAAEQYAISAVRADPDEYWYLHTLMQALEAQYRQPENMADLLPLNIPEFRLNLATWYLEQGKAEKVLAQLEGLPATDQVVVLRQQASQLEAGVSSEGQQAEGAPDDKPAEGAGAMAPKEGTAAYFEKQLEGLLVSKGWDAALELGSEAIETYPLQPFFYLAKGRALLGLGRAEEAVGILEAGEEFLLETGELAIRIYTALAEGYTVLGKMEKAAAYKAKIKNGSQ